MNMSLTQTNLFLKVKSKHTQPKILFHYICYTLPMVKKELQHWREEAIAGAEMALQIQALNSLRDKDFHCYGGAVFAIAGDKKEKELVKLIVAYQTICDYLDNLCDRNDCLEGEAFKQLHNALLDALQPETPVSDYYLIYPNKNDGSYLDKLVNECRTQLQKLPSYNLVQEKILLLAHYYIDLQVKKHIQLSERESTLKSWASNHLLNYPEIYWQEFSAASGSTLALFALLALASHEQAAEVQIRETMDAYFPWICGLHILLDYFIDQEEDRQGGDLNFTFFYNGIEETIGRLKYFIRQSHLHAAQITNAIFAKTVIEGLLALYLSDQKIKVQRYQKLAKELLSASGSSAWRTYRLCSLVRRYF